MNVPRWGQPGWGSPTSLSYLSLWVLPAEIKPQGLYCKSSLGVLYTAGMEITFKFLVYQLLRYLLTYKTVPLLYSFSWLLNCLSSSPFYSRTLFIVKERGVGRIPQKTRRLPWQEISNNYSWPQLAKREEKRDEKLQWGILRHPMREQEWDGVVLIWSYYCMGWGHLLHNACLGGKFTSIFRILGTCTCRRSQKALRTHDFACDLLLSCLLLWIPTSSCSFRIWLVCPGSLHSEPTFPLHLKDK